MTRRTPSLLLVAAAAASLAMSPAIASACGGFFCDAVIDPVVQTAERVLFRVNDDDTITSVIEIQFEGEPTDFAWVLPLSEAIDPQSVSTAPAGLFDALEELTAPRFFTSDAMAGADAASLGMSNGCSCGGPYYDDFWGDSFVGPDFSGIDVVGRSVAGPYAIEIITADDAGALLQWLQFNGYQIPSTAQEPIAAYVNSGGAFLGVKLNPDVPAGPIDALEITFPGTEPMLPLLLTSVAAVENMDVTTYVLAEERYAPDNYVDHDFDWSRVEWTGVADTDYEARLPAEVDALGGRAFVTEFAGATELLPLEDGPLGKSLDEQPTPIQAASELLRTGRYISRFRTVISPTEMTEDPVWVPAPDLGDVSNQHVLGANTTATARLPITGSLPLWLFAALGLGFLRRRA
ncbi:MAG: DUF2330 domain-containing protein [Deltaproteobacteria bacterium]|nr:DUF2330 domain-containing protein [Deltaproteobacteria bacterium]